MTGPKPNWTILELVKWTTSYFTSQAIDAPRLTGEILLAHALQMRRIDLYLRHDQPLNPDELAHFKQLLKRRLRREPIAYILGEKEFWSLDFQVTPAVLIPRPETECLVGAVIEDLNAGNAAEPKQILDLGTGSGCIVIALASEQPQHQFLALDHSIEALGVARQNACCNGLDNEIRFLASDWFSALSPGKPAFDIITANAPYIPSAAIQELAPEITRYEPRQALDGGADGLDEVRTIIDQAQGFLKPGGRLYLEFGHDQADRIGQYLSGRPQYDRAIFLKDLAGLDRIAVIQKTIDSHV